LERPGDLAHWIKMWEERGVALDQITILHRYRYQSLELELLLAQYRIPYRSLSGSFFEHPLCMDLLAYFELLQKGPAETAWNQVARHVPFIGATSIDLERLPTLRHTMAEFVRDSRGAADLSLMAACVRNEVLYYMRNIQHQHHQREKTCKVA
jgi:superfamily I DNA/RNA helicase